MISDWFVIRELFVLRETGEPFHHLITWQDLRASEYVKSWNDSRIMKVFLTILFFVTVDTVCDLHHSEAGGLVLIPVFALGSLH